MHTASEFLRWRQGIGQAAIRIGQFIKIEEDGRRDMPAFIFGARVTARIGHKPGGIDHAQIGRTDFFSQPFGAYEDIHVRPLPVFL